VVAAERRYNEKTVKARKARDNTRQMRQRMNPMKANCGKECTNSEQVPLALLYS
jgi:hypothetical protein